MKNQYYYLALSLFSLLMMGCSNDSAMDTPESTRMVPVGIRQVSVSGSAAITRASTTITDGQIGVFRTTANGYPAQNNVPYSYDAASGGWSATTTDNAILVDHRNATLLAYYPYQADADGSKVTLTSQVYAANQDLCYGTSTGTINNATPNAGVFTDMAHTYSRITLSIQRHATSYFTGVCAITNLHLKSGSSFFATRTLDISNNAYGGSTTDIGWSYNPNITSLAAGTSTDCDVLVPPQPVASGLTITLTIDGLNRAVTIPAAQFTSNALAAGQQYTIKLTIMDTAVIFDGNVAITDYTTDGTTIKNDTPKEV